MEIFTGTVEEAVRRIERVKLDGLDARDLERDLMLAAPEAAMKIAEADLRASEAPMLRRQLKAALAQDVWTAADAVRRMAAEHGWFLAEARPMLARACTEQAKAGLIAGQSQSCAVFKALDQVWPLTGQDAVCAAGLGPMRCSVPARARTHPWEYPQLSLEGGIFRWKGRRVTWPA